MKWTVESRRTVVEGDQYQHKVVEMRWGTSKTVHVETCAAEDVYLAELDEIAIRRQAAQNAAKLEARNAKHDLVGVALSGGGVRSGAVGLGFIPGMYEKGLLPFVDYLSTVSGGGYAGAYLSSVSLSAKKAGLSDSENGSTLDKPAQQHEFPIKSEANGKQPQRILDFIFGSHYLKRTWAFTNRYLFGLLLTWLVTLSGLFMICAFTAWCFRWLDSPWCSSWLTAIGIESDFSRAFVPAIVMGMCWFLVWMISYWRNGARATGGVPQIFCRAMIFCFALGFAGLIGTGDLTMPAVFGQVQTEKAEASNWNTLRTLILSAIVASLLPYFTFGRLIRSGTNPKGGGEKYIFYLATNALVYGVPFAVFAYFAHENISHWNERRSNLLTPAELRNTDPSHPLWKDLKRIADLTKDASKAQEEVVNVDKTGERFWAFNPSDLDSPRDIFSSPNEVPQGSQIPKKAEYYYSKTYDQLLILQSLAAMRAELNQPEHHPAKNSLSTWVLRIEESPPTTWNYIKEHSRYATPPNDRQLSLPRRWLLLCQYGLQRLLFESEEEYSQNTISRLARNSRETSKIKWEIVDAVNRQLADKSLYQRLIPSAPTNTDGKSMIADESDFVADDTKLQFEFQGIAPSIPATKDVKTEAEAKHAFDDWRARVLQARLIAASVAKRSPNPDEWKREIPDVDPELLERVSEDLNEAHKLLEEKWRHELIAANRGLMSAYYGLGVVGPKDIVFATNVLYEDQLTRTRWFLGSLVVFLLASLLVDLNFTSWHGYYSEQIGGYWIEAVPGLGNRLPLAQLETTKSGRPYHLLTGCMNRIGVSIGKLREPQAPFLFSKLYCGSDRTGYEPTAVWMGGNYTLQDAVAVSGGAVSPVNAQNPLVMGLLLLFNIRLGQWVDSPGKRQHFRWFVAPIHVVLNLFRKFENRKIRFITDGGHVENLGIEPLLKRRCRLIVAVDASQDEDYQYADFEQLMRRMRLNEGIVLVTPGDPDRPLSLINMRTCQSGEKARQKFVTSNVLLAEIRYPEADQSEPSYLIYLKSCLTGREPLELIQLAERSDFPHDPTSDQFLAPERFDAYRLLGNYLASTMVDRIPEDVRYDLPRLRQAEFIDRIVSIQPNRSTPRPRSEQVEHIMQVVKNETADSFERRSAARALLHQQPFPAGVLADLITLLGSVNDDVAEGVIDAIVAAECSAVQMLIRQLQREQPTANHREIQRIARALARIQQEMAEPLNDVVGVISDVLRKTAANASSRRKPTRVWTKAWQELIELIDAIWHRQSVDDPMRVELVKTLEKIAETTPHEELRRAAEFLLMSRAADG